LIKDIFNLKEDLKHLSDKQESQINIQIEKYKKECYEYKCQNDQMKTQLYNLNSSQINNFKELNYKVDKYRERSKELEKITGRLENEKKELLHKYSIEKEEVYRKIKYNRF
jgi:hypothetical protein